MRVQKIKEDNSNNDAHVQEFVSWLIINVFVPLLPVLLKIILVVFGDQKKITVALLDSSELLYYNLFMCVTFFNLSYSKKTFAVYEIFLRLIMWIICIVDLSVIILIYINIEAGFSCKVAAILLSLIVPVVVSVYYYKDGAASEKSLYSNEHSITNELVYNDCETNQNNKEGEIE